MPGCVTSCSSKCGYRLKAQGVQIRIWPLVLSMPVRCTEDQAHCLLACNILALRPAQTHASRRTCHDQLQPLCMPDLPACNAAAIFHHCKGYISCAPAFQGKAPSSLRITL